MEDTGQVSMQATLMNRIDERSARIVIVGQGYVGLPLAMEFARAGYVVQGLDADHDRVIALGAGRSYIADVPDADVRAQLDAGRYEPTGDPAVMAQADVIIICVPTPLGKTQDPDISYVVSAAEQAAAHFRPGQLVLLESTTYPGTTEEILLPLFTSRGARIGDDLFLAFSPERIDPGNTRFRVRDIPKVVGGVTPACTRLAAALYRTIIAKIVEVSSPKVAELAKLYENTFRNVNIALANEFSLICRHLGVSSREVIDAAASKPFGFLPFYPGPGIGGHCIGVDPVYLSWKMRANGYRPPLIEIAAEVNRSMPKQVVGLVIDALNGKQQSVSGARILVLGVAYKRGVSDTRESPALEIITALRDRGADVTYSDPYVAAIDVAGMHLKSEPMAESVVASADCVLILTDHAEFDYARILAWSTCVVDTRNATWGLDAPTAGVVRL
jgi:UDP-N-acetyl-D-glucosamine dehydrogenase